MKMANQYSCGFSVALVYDVSYNIIYFLKIYLKGDSSLGVILLQYMADHVPFQELGYVMIHTLFQLS